MPRVSSLWSSLGLLTRLPSMLTSRSTAWWFSSAGPAICGADRIVLLSFAAEPALLRVEHDAHHEHRLGAVVDPVVVRTALDHDVERVQRHLAVVHEQRD